MFPNSVWQLDIFILKKYEKYNKNYSDILCAVDVFSRKVYIEKMKNKEAQTVTDAFRSILKVAENIPQVLVSDTDSSFTSREFKKLIEKEKINNVFVPI